MAVSIHQPRESLRTRRIRTLTIVTTHPTLSIAQVASVMFSRWSQENDFKYRRDQFSFDALISHALAPMDDDTMVVNPRWRKLENQLHKLKERISTVRNHMAILRKNEAKAKQRDSLSQESRLLKPNTKSWAREYRADSLTRRCSSKFLSVLTCCLNHSGFSSTSCA